MKKLLALLMIAALPMGMIAQNAFAGFYEKYAGTEGFTSVNVSPDLFEMFASMEMEGDEEIAKMKEAVHEFNGLQVLTFEDKYNSGKAMQYYKEVADLIPANAYKELVTVNSPDDNVQILTKGQKDGLVDKLLIVVGNEDEFVFVQVDGKFDLRKISEMSGDMDEQRLEELKEKMKHKRK